VHIGGAASYSDPMLEAVDIRQIYDKFPEKRGGLKELFDKGPQNAFFLVKFWADLSTNINEDAGAFYAVTSQYVHSLVPLVALISSRCHPIQLDSNLSVLCSIYLLSLGTRATRT